MTTPVHLTLAVGEPPLIPLSDAVTIAAAAQRAGIAAIRLVDGPGTLDPTVVAAYLAGRHGGIGYLAEVPTTHHAPYNVARRILSLDRATGGRIGLVLQAGDGDEVSDQVTPRPGGTDPVQRWTEYAEVLTRLWESFPRRALIGDQAAGLVVDDTLIKAINHAGAFYRVAGPLDGPSSVQGRPVIAADLGTLDLTAVARSVDVVVVSHRRAVGADAALTGALRRAGRRREEVALLGRVESVTADPGALRTWAGEHRLDGFELAPRGDTEAILRELVPLPDGSTRPENLRAALGLRDLAAVPA